MYSNDDAPAHDQCGADAVGRCRRRRGAGSSIAAATLVLAMGLAGCSSGRSVEAFCSTYWDEKKAYVEKYDQAAEDVNSATDPLTGLVGGTVMIASSIGDVVVMFDKLEKAAPESIQPDVAAIRDSMKSQLDGLSGAGANPLAALATGLVQGLTTTGSWQRVGDYVIAECGEKGPP